MITYTAYSKRFKETFTFGEGSETYTSKIMWQLFDPDTEITIKEGDEVLEVIELENLFNKPNI